MGFPENYGGSSCSYSFFRARSFASLSGTIAYKFFTSRDITFFLISRLMLFKFSLASELVPMFAPLSFLKNVCKNLVQAGYNRSYQAMRGPVSLCNS